MNVRFPNLIWIGAALAVLYWLIESAIHTFIFNSGTLAATLFGEHDPNEVWMRLLTSALFVAFGAIAERVVRTERHMKDDALRLNRLLQYVDRITHRTHRTTETTTASSAATQLEKQAEARIVSRSTTDENHRSDTIHLTDIAAGEDDYASLARLLQELSSFLDWRYNELYALLQLSHEINMGLLLDEVLEKAFESLRSVIPYTRMSVAMLEDNGAVLRARWARSDSPKMFLKRNYTGRLKGSSLQLILNSGEPRIINDLAAYFALHPQSDSTRLMVDEGIRSSLTCPLISMGKPIGFIFFSSNHTGVYKNAHVELFKLIAGHFSVVVEKSNLYQEVLREKAKSEALLLNVMPERIAARLRDGEEMIAETLTDTNVLFADIVHFTDFAGAHAPEVVVNVLQQLFVRFDQLCDEYGVEKIKTIGDAYMATCGPSGSPADGHVRHIASFALALIAAAREIHYPDGQEVLVRIGLNTGTVVAGVIGQKKFFYDMWGDTVNVASRMESTGEAGRIQVSEAVYTKLKNEYLFEPRGEIDVKGKGVMRTYFLVGEKGAALQN